MYCSAPVDDRSASDDVERDVTTTSELAAAEATLLGEPVPEGVGYETIEDAEPGPAIESLAVATWALFVGIAAMLIGAGLFGTLVAVRSELDGYGSVAIGLISGGYYAGFLAGSRWSIRVLGTVGHIRVYAALASVLSAAIVLTGLVANPIAWILLRFLAGACLAGQFVVAESWLNQLVRNESRGRTLAFYTTVTVVAFGSGQFLFSRVDPDALTGFGVSAILISLAITPVALSGGAAPPLVAAPEKMSLRDLWALVPTGVVTSILVGITHGSFLGLGAVYAARLGLSTTEIGVFVAMPTLGSLVLSIPVTSLSDRHDRRAIGALTAVFAGAAAIGVLEFGPDHILGLTCMAVIGGLTYPLYSISGAYTNDWVPTERLTAAAGQLVLLFGAGAFLGPIIGAAVMGRGGANGFVWMTIGTHAAVALYLIVRIAQHPPSQRAKPWNAVPVAGRVLYLPATAVAMGRRLRPQRRRRRPPRD